MKPTLLRNGKQTYPRLHGPPLPAEPTSQDAFTAPNSVSNAQGPAVDPPMYIDTARRRQAPGLQLIGERAHRFYFLDCQLIDYLHVDGNYITLHVGNDRYLTRSTLKRLSDVLTPHHFMQIDRGVLLNLQQVEYVERLESGQFAFQLRCGQHLIANRERSGAIARLLRNGVR